MTSPRDRYRQQVREEAKKIAWEQVAQTGAAGISVNAIAKRMGVSGPALYRYFKNRDELITELIHDAYHQVADVLRATKTPEAAAKALRQWALEHPHRYFLINGTPVPGYHAPPETTESARGAMRVLLDLFDNDERRALTFWTRTHGVISLEIAGAFNGMDFDRDELYADEVESIIS